MNKKALYRRLSRELYVFETAAMTGKGGQASMFFFYSRLPAKGKTQSLYTSYYIIRTSLLPQIVNLMLFQVRITHCLQSKSDKTVGRNICRIVFSTKVFDLIIVTMYKTLW